MAGAVAAAAAVAGVVVAVGVLSNKRRVDIACNNRASPSYTRVR